MKKYILEFLHKGLCACGFGPLVWAAVYFFLERNGIVEVLTVRKAIVEIVMVSMLAFIAGGINVVHKIERLPLMIAIFIHGVVLYLDYVIIYLFNGWLHSGVRPLAVFTACFFAGYAVVWVIIYLINNRNTRRLNQKLSMMQNQDGTNRVEKHQTD